MITNGFSRIDIVFSEKADAVPYSSRLSYKLAQVCLILSKCCGRKGCSLLKMQVIATSMYTRATRQRLLSFLNDAKEESLLIGLDPSVNRAMMFAQGYGLIRQQKNGLFRLTDKGKAFVSSMQKNVDIMSDEIYFLNKISSELSEEMIKEQVSVRGYQSANY